MAPPKCCIGISLLLVFWGCEENSLPEVPPIPHYITSFGTFGPGPGEFEYPYAIALGPDSLLYTSDFEDRVQIFTTRGEFVRQWPAGGLPTMIVVGPDSSVFAKVSPRVGFSVGISRFSKDGQPTGGLSFVNVVDGFEVDGSGNCYVSGRRIYSPDRDHTFVQGPYIWKFNPEGELIKKWGYLGEADTTGWSGGPMTWNPKGNLLVMGQIDTTTAVFEFTPEGELRSSWRFPGLEQYKLEDIACDRAGRILISSSPTGLVYIFDSHGHLLFEFGEVSKDEEPLKTPAGLVVDTNGFIYVVDTWRFRIVKYQQAP